MCQKIRQNLHTLFQRGKDLMLSRSGVCVPTFRIRQQKGGVGLSSMLFFGNWMPLWNRITWLYKRLHLKATTPVQLRYFSLVPEGCPVHMKCALSLSVFLRRRPLGGPPSPSHGNLVEFSWWNSLNGPLRRTNTWYFWTPQVMYQLK